MESENKLNLLQKVVIYMENSNETLKVASYGIASISLLVALHRIKPFSKFKIPSKVPNHFLKNKTPLQGTVKQIEPHHGTLLMVDHKPLIPLPQLGSKRYLPIKMSGINVTSHGISWLQSVLRDKEITFIPLRKQEKYLECIVMTMQPNKECLKVGEELVKLGFATLHEIPLMTTKDKQILAYCKNLEKAQKWAIRKRNGQWHFIKHPTLLWKLQQNLAEKIKSIMPTFISHRLNI